MTGKIIKGIAGFYYVYVVESGIYECKAVGIFRRELGITQGNVSKIVAGLEKKLLTCTCQSGGNSAPQE